MQARQSRPGTRKAALAYAREHHSGPSVWYVYPTGRGYVTKPADGKLPGGSRGIRVTFCK